jgi:hypothetical protein
VRPLVIALVLSFRNRRDGRVATFRPIPQSVSGVGVRFSIGDKIRNLGEKSFCLTRRQRKVFILLRCCNNFSFFILTELGVGRIVGKVGARLVFCELSKEKSVPTVRQLLIRAYKIQEASGHLHVSYCVAEFPSDALLQLLSCCPFVQWNLYAVQQRQVAEPGHLEVVQERVIAGPQLRYL